MKTTRTQNVALLGTFLLLVVSAVGWFLLISPRLSEADEISTQAAEVANSNIALQHRYSETLQQATTATSAAADAQALFSTMPQEADLPAVLTQISDAATRAGIKPNDISTITATVPVAVAGSAPDPASGTTSGVNLAQMQLSLTVNGKQQQLLDFLTNLQTLDRAVLITSNELTSSVTKDAKGRDVTNQTLAVSGSMFVLQSQLPDLVAKVQGLLDQAQAEVGTTTVTTVTDGEAAAA
jgi:Tfp pilus assembly protein PilO